MSCNKCSRTFHALCVGGANYSKKKSKNGIWLCTACVKCKNCGATTPGPLPGSKWTHDFSLCAQCGKLMDQGSCCPLCHKWLVKLPSFTLFAVSIGFFHLSTAPSRPSTSRGSVMLFLHSVILFLLSVILFLHPLTIFKLFFLTFCLAFASFTRSISICTHSLSWLGHTFLHSMIQLFLHSINLFVHSFILFLHSLMLFLHSLNALPCTFPPLPPFTLHPQHFPSLSRITPAFTQALFCCSTYSCSTSTDAPSPLSECHSSYSS